MAQKPLDSKQMQQAVDALAASNGNETMAAKLLGMPKSTFQNRISAAERAHIVAAKEEKLNTTARHAQLHMGALKDSRNGKVRRYVVTSAQNATPVQADFFASLLSYCKLNGAELIVIPFRYQNPTSVWTEKSKSYDWWPSEVMPYLLDKRIELNKNLVVLADIKIQPTATRPLSGMDTMTGSQSAILAHPKLELVTVPTPHHKLPKILTTTGACTKRNYTETKAGKKGSFHHTYGACVVEVSGESFHMRQLNAISNGSFMDLNYEYTGAGRKKVDQIEALVCGDTHHEFVDPEVVEATFGKDGIASFLRPKLVVWHDIWDGYSRNHHHEGEAFINFVKHQAGVDDVEKALDNVFAFVDKYTLPNSKNVFIPSNHPDVLAKWVKRADWREDPRNAKFLLRTALAMIESAEMGLCGAQVIDPFQYWAKKKMKSASQAIFLKRDESFQVKGIELAYHGDRGPNGSRGSIKGFTRIGVKSVIGHSHTPGIMDGVYQTGCNSYLKLEYNSGPSSWMQSDCIVYKNGKRSLINIVNGQWRA